MAVAQKFAQTHDFYFAAINYDCVISKMCILALGVLSEHTSELESGCVVEHPTQQFNTTL